jgi:protein transport protein SEC31
MELAVDLCVRQNRFAEALILAIRGGPELLQKTQARYFQQEAEHGSSDGFALVEAVTMDSWVRLVQNCAVDSWKEALAALLTYTQLGDRESLAGGLAERLAAVGRDSEAMLCYTVAWDMDRVVESWLTV